MHLKLLLGFGKVPRWTASKVATSFLFILLALASFLFKYELAVY